MNPCSTVYSGAVIDYLVKGSNPLSCYFGKVPVFSLSFLFLCPFILLDLVFSFSFFSILVPLLLFLFFFPFFLVFSFFYAFFGVISFCSFFGSLPKYQNSHILETPVSTRVFSNTFTKGYTFSNFLIVFLLFFFLQFFYLGSKFFQIMMLSLTAVKV